MYIRQKCVTLRRFVTLQAHTPLPESELQREILGLLFASRAGITRQQVSGALDISRTKVSSEVKRLLALGLLEDAGLADSNGGRRSSLLRVARGAGIVVAVDLGATSADVALTTLSGDVLAHAAEPAEIGDGPEAVLGRVNELVDQLLRDRGATRDELIAIGVGVPGPVEQPAGRLVAPPIMPGWNGFSVREALEAEYSRPVAVDNDVNIMALGEHTRGRGRGVGNMLFVKVGTGIGSGLLIDGRLYRGTNGCAGDIGHITAAPDGPICTCGNRGCLEAIAAAPAIARAADASARSGASALLAERLTANGSLTAYDVGEAAAHGDHEALRIIRAAGTIIGETLASVVSVLNPSLIVVGGGVAHIGHSLLAEIRTAVYKRSLPLATRDLPILVSELDAMAGVIGASVLAAGIVLAVPAT